MLVGWGCEVGAAAGAAGADESGRAAGDVGLSDRLVGPRSCPRAVVNRTATANASDAVFAAGEATPNVR
jgi:hypothetical protein